MRGLARAAGEGNEALVCADACTARGSVSMLMKEGR